MATSEGGYLEAKRSGAFSQRGPASISYSSVDVAGFEILPGVVRAKLRSMGIVGKTTLCASCEGLLVRRRANGSFYQTGTAWWGNESHAAMIEIRREMEHRSGPQYAPIGEWNASGTAYHLGDAGGPERTTWQFEAAAASGDGSSPQVTTDDPLDLLPPDLAAPVRGGLSDVWRESSSTSATEYLTAFHVDNHEVLLLEANRSAHNKDELVFAPWEVTTLMAPITKSESFSFTCEDLGLTTGARTEIHDGRVG